MTKERITEIEKKLSIKTQKFIQTTSTLISYEKLSAFDVGSMEDDMVKAGIARKDFNHDDLTGDGPYTEEGHLFGKMANDPSYWVIRTLKRVQELMKEKEKASSPMEFHGMKLVHLNAAMNQAAEELGTQAVLPMMHSYLVVFKEGLAYVMVDDFYKKYTE